MYRRYCNLYCQRSSHRRRHRSLEQQQYGSCDSKCSRIGHRNISRYMQYHLYHYRRLWRNCISTAVRYNKSECRYHFCYRTSHLYVSEEQQPILQTELSLGGGTGAWSSSNTAVATVSAAGLVTGMSAGTCNIIYTITGGCGGTVSAQQSVTINPNASYHLGNRNNSVMYRRHGNLYCQRCVLRRRHRSMEQQQYSNCNSKSPQVW